MKGGNFSAIAWSLLILAAIAGGFLVTVRFTAPAVQPPAAEVIQAEVISAEALERREQEKIEAARRAEEARQAELRRQREAELAEQRRREEAARQVELRRQEELRRRQAEEEARRQAAEEEKRRQAEAERKRREEAEQRRREEEARRKAEEERQRREAEAEARRQRESELQTQIEAEERRLAAIRSGAQAQWIGAINNKVERQWQQPPDIGENYHCEFRVRQIPGGEVVAVNVVRCDNEVLRRSCETAIWRASPLPPPPDPSLFEQYVNIVFSPEN